MNFRILSNRRENTILSFNSISTECNPICYNNNKKRSRVEIQKPSREQCTLVQMTGCTGGGHPNHAVLHPFRGLHLKRKTYHIQNHTNSPPKIPFPPLPLAVIIAHHTATTYYTPPPPPPQTPCVSLKKIGKTCRRKPLPHPPKKPPP